MQAPVVAWIGESDSPEFQPAHSWLHEHVRLTSFPDCAAAASSIASGNVLPMWMILAAARRSAFAPREVERLHRRAPLTRLVTLLGSWCEGEARSGAPLPGVARVYWYEFLPRAAAELLGPRRQGYAGWSLPRTAAPVDLFLQLQRTMLGRKSAAARVAIVAPTADRYQALADAAQACGAAECPWLRHTSDLTGQAFAAVLHDADSLKEPTTAALRAWSEAAAGTPHLLFLPHPRAHEVEVARQLGIAAILAKPFLLGDLAAQLSPLLGRAKRATAA